MSVVVLLYSKYSTACETLLQKMSVMDFRKICVDHEEVRKLVVADQKKYSIQKVPCILVFFSNGLVKKYEGEDAFAWVDETIEKMRVLTTPPPPVMFPNERPFSRPPAPVQQHENEPEDASPLVKTAFSTFSTLPVRESIAVQPVESESSSMTNDDNVPDMRRAMDSAPLPIQKLKAMPPPQSEEGEGDAAAAPMRGIKSDKQENLMSLAQQMQKQREKEDETIQKVSA